MDVIQRAMLYISRKKGKTVSLFLVVFAAAVFLISCFRLLNGAEALSKEIRTSLGAAFYIRANTEVSMNETGETQVKENNIHITGKEIDEIMQTGDIKYYNPINYGFAKSDRIRFIPGDKHTEENNMGKVTALRFSALAPDFTEETAVLAEGKHITETDSGKILISERLASANQLSVGDTLTLTHARFGEADGTYIDEIPVKTAYAKVQVSGIYKRKIQDTSDKPTAGIADNEIYASLDVLNELHESAAGIYTGEVDFYITDPAKLETITRNVQLLQSIDWNTHFIRTNDFQYSRIADQLSSLGDLVKIFLVLVSVVSTVCLNLLLTLRMRGRMQEAGILLAAGVSKGQIMAGFFLEVWSVAIVALMLSYIASLCVTGILGHRMFGGLHSNLLNEETIRAGIGDRLPIENYLKTNGLETLLIYFCQLVVITVSTWVSSMIIMRLKPKEILSKMS
ncbi:MAG: FtsX-like permease family protein [Lachnospiraceae bacterium]|jgi:putative ABC transport system permease protein|nr:FtsX-like permease family protein [Lachnospiraceae bacterium]